MATILRIPSSGAPGVVVFTTQERDAVIYNNAQIRRGIEKLKTDGWMVGLHHNWHDAAFRYDPLFDFSMAGEDDLHAVDGRPFPLVPMDACNFVPDFFRHGVERPFWDVLYIARAVFFKRIPEFFSAIRSLYDSGRMDRVLLISPVPPYRRGDRRTVFYDIRSAYDRLFSSEEQERFTLLTIEFRYPFPFDLQTLAHFYRSSRIFVHFADEERRCRVAAYAWASGLPVVGMPSVASLLPAGLRREPMLYQVERFEDFPAAMSRAIDAGPLSEDDISELRAAFVTSKTVPMLQNKLSALFNARMELALASSTALDRRLGRHHGLGSDSNNVPQSLESLISVLQTDPDVVAAALRDPDPEILIASRQEVASKRFAVRFW